MKLLNCCVAAILTLLVTHAVAQPLKIGFVDGARLEKESVLTIQMQEEMKKEFAPRDQQLQSLQKQALDMQTRLEKEGDKMPSADRDALQKNLAATMQRFEQLRRSSAEELEALRREKLQRVLEQVNAIIKGIAEAGKYDLIIQEAVWGTTQIDITDQVLKEIAKRAGK